MKVEPNAIDVCYQMKGMRFIQSFYLLIIKATIRLYPSKAIAYIISSHFYLVYVRDNSLIR